MAEQYRQQIEQGKGLPPEIDHDIRMLDADRKDMLDMAKVDEMAAAQAQQTLSDLQAQSDEVQQLKTELELTFHKAGSQQMLLSKVAALRATRCSGAKMCKQIADVSNAVGQQKKAVGQMNSRLGALLDQILKRDISLKGSHARKTPDRPRPNGDRYLEVLLTTVQQAERTELCSRLRPSASA